MKKILSLFGYTLLILGLYGLKGLKHLFAGAEKMVEYFCVQASIMEVSGGFVKPTFESAFTDKQIEGMANKLTGEETLGEIQQKHNVSYRQARKIREVFDNTIQINKPVYS